MDRSNALNPVGHLGIIPDGGRRWARANGVTFREAYDLSMKKIAEYMDVLFAGNVAALTLYLLSRQNLLRNREELDAVVGAEADFISTLLPSLIRHRDIQVTVAGTQSLLPPVLARAVDSLSTERSSGTKRLFLLLAYDPFDEIIAAQKRGIRFVNESELLEGLWVNSKLDLIVRSGGAISLSDFVPLQAGYARIVFLNKLFNDTSIEDFLGPIRDQESRPAVKGW